MNPFGPLTMGVALILDIDLKLLEQPSVEDESVDSIAGSQRSLSARARSCTMCWPVSFFQRAPQRFILISTDFYRLLRRCQYQAPNQVGDARA